MATKTAAAFQATFHGSFMHSLIETQTGSNSRASTSRQIHEHVAGKIPGVLQETEFDCRQWDKAFACAWLNDTEVLVGTKCNHVLLVNTNTSKCTDIPLPEAPPRPANTTTQVYPTCGNHSLAFNPSQTLLVTGGSNPCDAVVLRSSDMTPLQTFADHQDWIFSCAWVTDTHFITGSRDRTVKLWSVSDTSTTVVTVPLKTAARHQGKVRDVKVDKATAKAFSLGTDSNLKVWDSELNEISNIGVPFDRELVCMTVNEHLVAVGSQSHITLIDARVGKNHVGRILDNLDGNHGVRSLSFAGHLLGAGSGRGRMCFFDLRARMHVPCTQAVSGTPKDQYLQTGKGWLCHDETYMQHFFGMPMFNACYAHAWDPSSTKVFACGGPLAFGLKGCYMGVWQ